MSILAPTLEAYFTERLIGQRHASPNTIASYRDAWRLLLRFVSARTGKQPCQRLFLALRCMPEIRHRPGKDCYLE